MEREEVNAITSLARTKDWKVFKEYVEGAVREIERTLGYIDCTKSDEIARMQGARMALGNILDLERVAKDRNEPEES